MPVSNKHSRPSRPRAESDAGETPPPQDIEDIRYQLACKLARLVHRWQWPACPRRACRRHRLCATPTFVCANARPPRNISPQRQAAALARLYRDRWRLAEAAGEGSPGSPARGAE